MTTYADIMTKLQARRLGGAPSLDVIAHGIIALEAVMKSKLPEEYRRFVEAWGGTAFGAYVVFQIEGNPATGAEAILDVAFGILPGSTYDLAANLPDGDGLLPAGWLPVAQDPGGNLVCLCLSREDYGSVYYLHRDTSIEQGGRPALYRIAKSWHQFIHALEWRAPEDF